MKTGRYRYRTEWWQAFPELSACSYVLLRYVTVVNKYVTVVTKYVTVLTRYVTVVTKYANYQQISKHEFTFCRTRSFNIASKEARYFGLNSVAETQFPPRFLLDYIFSKIRIRNEVHRIVGRTLSKFPFSSYYCCPLQLPLSYFIQPTGRVAR